VVVIGLFSIGVGSGIIILYDYLESPHLISKDQAFEDALKFGGFDKTQLVNETVDMKLLQIMRNGLALVLDDKTLKSDPIPVFVTSGSTDEYVWQVKITKKLDEYSSHEWSYLMDASNGTLLESGNHGIEYPRSLNHTSS
jgi:hypothetical protein